MSEPLPEHARRRLLDDARESLETEGLVHGRYRLVRELGRGGMGVVHEAEDVELRRRVALKFLHLPPGLGPGLAGQVLREARAAARLSHPGIAAVYDAYVEDGGGTIAMQLVEGRSLDALERAGPRVEARRIRDAALALQHAHDQGVVHRDLKPGNLLIEGERVVVTDFGLAKELALDATLASGALSRSGSVLGTPGYMPPEQAAGRAREVDARSDVYALGATLYDRLAGRPPFASSSDLVSLLRAVVEHDPPPLARLAPDVPRDLALIVHRCLEKEQARRYPSARELAEDLDRWLSGQPVQARAPSLGYRLGKLVRRHRALVGVAALAALVSLTALAFTWNERAERRATELALALSEEVEAVLDDTARLSAAPVRAGSEAAEPGSEGGADREAALARLDQGIRSARAFLERHDVASGHALLGRLLRARGRTSEARQELDRALVLDESLHSARLERGLLVAGLFARGASTLDLDPSDAHSLPSELAELRARALEDLALVDLDASGLRRAAREHGRAERARLAGDLETAERAFEEVLRLDPLSVDARVALAQLAGARGDDEAARKSAMSAIDLALGRGPAYAHRPPSSAPLAEDAVARAVRQLERDAERVALDRAVEARPFDPEARARRGLRLVADGEARDGRADLEAALFLGASGDLRAEIERALGPTREDDSEP